MIDLDEYHGLFQKIEDQFQGLTAPDHEFIDTDEKDVILLVERRGRGDLHSSSSSSAIALADERDDLDTDFGLMQETEDKISAELLELSDLMRSGSKDDRTNKRDTMPPGGSWLGGRRPRVEVRVLRGEQKRHTTELDKAIMKQLEAFQISGKAKQDCKNKKHQTDEETTTMEERIEDTLQHISGSSQDEIHIFQSNSQIDSFDASLHEKCNIHATNQRSSPMMKEENVEVAAIFHGDLQVEIDDESEKILSSSERGLKETYPLEFSGRAPSSSRCAKSLLCRDPSISSSSSDESSLLWLDEKLDI